MLVLSETGERFQRTSCVIRSDHIQPSEPVVDLSRHRHSGAPHAGQVGERSLSRLTVGDGLTMSPLAPSSTSPAIRRRSRSPEYPDTARTIRTPTSRAADRMPSSTMAK